MRLNALRPGCWLFPPWAGNGYLTCVDMANIGIRLKRTKKKFLFLRFRAKAPPPGTVGARGAAGRGLPPAAASEKQNSPCGHCLGARPVAGARRPLTAPSRGPGGAGREVCAFPWDENGFPWDGTAFPRAVCVVKWPANGDEMARKRCGKGGKSGFSR